MYNLKLCSLCSLFISLFWIQNLFCTTPANTLYSGTLTTSNGNSVTANGNWKSNGGSFKIDWSITEVDSKTYNYSYSITNKDGGSLSSNLNYILLEISSAVTGSNLSSLITNFQNGIIVGNPSAFTSKINSNLPADIYALKIDTNSNSRPVFTFTSTLAPVWGNFFAQGFSSSTYAYNTDFTNKSSAMKLAIPGGGGAVVTPEPSTYLILGSILLSLGILNKRRKKVKN